MIRTSGPRSRRAQASPLLFPYCRIEGASPPKSKRGKADPTRPRRVVPGEAWLRRTLAFGADGLSPGWTAIARSLAVPPSISGIGTSRSPSAFICVICGQMGWMAGLRVFVSSCLRCAMALCPSSVPLCLCGSSVAGPWEPHEVCRAALRLGLLVPRGSVAARGPDRPCRRARARSGGSGRPQHRLRSTALLEGSQRSRYQGAGRRRGCPGRIRFRISNFEFRICHPPSRYARRVPHKNSGWSSEAAVPPTGRTDGKFEIRNSKFEIARSSRPRSRPPSPGDASAPPDPARG